MCGIIGVVGDAGTGWGARRDRMAPRGPDAAGEWGDETVPVWLGHRRLAIQDLSAAGAQPMESAGGRWVISYNGEIYNAAELRAELEQVGWAFRGHADTEVLLAAIEHWGVEGALTRLNGMFAFGLWDREQRALWLARDRMGIKPLVYALAPDGGRLAFASTLEPLRGLDWIDQSRDPAAVAAYFRWLNVPAPLTVLRGVRKLPPGHLLRWQNGSAELRRWWDLRAMAAAPKRTGLTLAAAAEELEPLLADAVRRQLVSDVPVGVFLSGGIDSTLVAALMARAGGGPVRSFTIGFAEASHDESPHAEAIAAHLGLSHTTRRFAAADMLAALPAVLASHDEPFADVGALPMRLLCTSARDHISVALAGDGGDELFGGYPRYYWAGRIQAARRRLGVLAPALAAALNVVPEAVWDGPVSALTGGRFTGSQGLAHRVRRLAGYLSVPEDQVYGLLEAAWPTPPVAACGTGGAGPDPAAFAGRGWAERMMAADQASYLPDEVLTKVDRASMAVSLEVRVPVLDHRVVEWAWTVPAALKLPASGDRGKPLLRAVLDRHVPAALMERPKMGFGVPLGPWLRGPLRPWAEALLEHADADPLLDAAALRARWRAFVAGRADDLAVWTALAYLAWDETCAR